MGRLIDITDERFWDILFDEARVEGQQADRIEKELEKIVAFDVEAVVKELEEMKTKTFVSGITWNPYELGACHAIDKAIEIVRKGGVK